MRILGLDFGDKTLGVSLSDPFLWTAQGLLTIKRKDENNLKETLKELKKIIDDYNVDKIVLGYPINMNHTEGPRCEKTKKFKERLEKEFNLEVVLWDERSSTKASEKILITADVSRKKRKGVIDKMAAVFILQGYLDALRSNSQSGE